MAYRQVYFRIRTDCYNSGWTSDVDRTAFEKESRRLFQELGWTATLGHNGGCDTVTMGQQDLHLHPSSFSGVIDEASIQPLQEQLSKARTFRCYHVDRYEEYRDLSDEAYRAELEAKRDEITSYVLEKCRTKRSKDGKNLEIHEKEAAIIRLIFTRYLSGESTTEIAAALTDMGLRTRDGKEQWNTFAVSYILQNGSVKIGLNQKARNSKRAPV